MMRGLQYNFFITDLTLFCCSRTGHKLFYMRMFSSSQEILISRASVPIFPNFILHSVSMYLSTEDMVITVSVNDFVVSQYNVFQQLKKFKFESTTSFHIFVCCLHDTETFLTIFIDYFTPFSGFEFFHANGLFQYIRILQRMKHNQQVFLITTKN